jgi:hypothetical protein
MSETLANETAAEAQSFRPLNVQRTNAAPSVKPPTYSAADAVSPIWASDGARVVVVAVVVNDFMSSSALEAMQTQKDFFWLLAVPGWEPTITKTSKTVAKIAKRRIGRTPDGGYGGGVIKVPQDYTLE